MFTYSEKLGDVTVSLDTQIYYLMDKMSQLYESVLRMPSHFRIEAFKLKRATEKEDGDGNPFTTK